MKTSIKNNILVSNLNSNLFFFIQLFYEKIKSTLKKNENNKKIRKKLEKLI